MPFEAAKIRTTWIIRIAVVVTLLAIPSVVLFYCRNDLWNAVQSSDFWKLNWGNVASVLGLALTWIGFTFTIMLTLESRSASKKAEEAAEKAEKQISHFDSIVELTEANSILDEIIRQHRDSRWTSLPDRYACLRARLVSIKHPSSDLNDQQKTRIAGVLMQLNEIDKEIEKCLMAGKANGLSKPSVKLELLKEQAVHLSDILAELRLTRS